MDRMYRLDSAAGAGASGKTLIDVQCNVETALRRELCIFHDRVRAVVRGKAAQGVVGFCQEYFLDPAVAESMKGKLGGVGTHLSEPVHEPFVELMTLDWNETTGRIGDPKDWSVWSAILGTIQDPESVEGPNGAEEGFVGPCEGGQMLLAIILVCFGETDLEDYAAACDVVQVPNPAPA